MENTEKNFILYFLYEYENGRNITKTIKTLCKARIPIVLENTKDDFQNFMLVTLILSTNLIKSFLSSPTRIESKQ